MDLSWDDRRTRQFLTNVALVTSDGPSGPNIMACEWTHHVSYAPSLIVVNIRANDATAENINSSKEFGINLASEEQNILCRIAGKYTGKQVDKISVLRDFGVVFYEAKKIKAPMIKGAAMNAECKLLKQEVLGDHTMFVGEVTEISTDENIRPLVYHNGKYWKLGDNIAKPPSEILDRIQNIAGKHTKVI